jgi:hypothetical protein
VHRPTGLVGVLAAVLLCAAADAAETEAGRIVIEPLLGGRRIETGAPVPAEVALDTTDPKVHRVLRARLANGVITLDDMELGAYTGVSRVEIDLGPGTAIAKLVHPLRSDGGELRATVDVEQLMRLVRPENTRFGVDRSHEDALPAFHSPVPFTWAGVPGATSYRLDVVVRGRPTEPTRMPIDITGTSARVELLPTDVDEYYTLSLEAFRKRKRIGMLAIDGTDMRRSPYRFRVVPPSVPADDPQPPARPVVPDVFGGSARLVLVPTLDGERWDLPPRTWVRIGLRNDSAMKSLDVRTTNGVAEIDGLRAGTCSPSLTIPADRGPGPHTECRTHYGEQPLEVRLTDGATTRREVPFRCTMRLRRPALPEKAPPRSAQAVSVDSPVTFEWTPVPRALRYTYEVKDGRSAQRTFARGEGTGTTWTTDLGPSLVPGDRYRIEVTAHGRNQELGRLDQAHVFRVSGGQPQPGTGSITLVPTYDGVPLARDGELPTEVRLQRLGGQGHRTIDTRLAHGVIELPGIETGVYGVSFVLDEKYPAPGPRSDTDIMWAATGDPVALLRDGESVRREIPMHRAFEIVEPAVAAIGASTPPDGAPEIPMVTSPVRIAWKPLRGATRYRVRLDIPMIDDEEPGERVSEDAAPSWTAELRATPPDEYYMVIIEAYGTRANLARTMFRFGVTAPGKR